MKYAIWFVRLVFAAWFIPAGLNHFIPLFPQPMGNMPLSQELISALIDSHLFDLVKAVELIAGISVLTGWYMPLMLVVCMPVSFSVWYWDTPLQGWGSVSAFYGWAALGTNALLCLACLGNYRAMLAPLAAPRAIAPRNLLLAGRLIFGAWMLLSGINYFVVTLYPVPAATEPLAVQLMTALADSHMFGVVKAIQLVAGALLLAGIFVPLALCVVMPISACTLFVGAILDHQPLGAVLALVFFALNGLLMLACLDSYKGVLAPRTLAFGETEADGGDFDRLLAIPMGGSSPASVGAGMVVLLAAAGFYYFLVPSIVSKFCLYTLLYPAAVLLARLAQGLRKPA
jgi:hypothetical protein